MPGNRKIQRLEEYDYSKYGGYFITLCVYERRTLFGEICNQVMHVNAAGQMVLDTWNRIPSHYSGVAIDEFQVMPDHIHGIVFIDHETGRARGPAPTDPLTLSDLVGRFKSYTTTQYIRGVHDHGWPPFNKQLWQRGFHDRIIRDDPELFRIRKYIHDNPASF